MKKDIENLLKNNANQIALLLLQMYPDYEEIIKYHQQQEVPFNEWFAFLFGGLKWKLEGPKEIPVHKIRISESKFREVEGDFKNPDKGYQILAENFDTKKLGYLTVVNLKGEYEILDGWHRFYLLNSIDFVNVPAYEWIKTPNDNEYSRAIRDLIVNKI